MQAVNLDSRDPAVPLNYAVFLNKLGKVSIKKTMMSLGRVRRSVANAITNFHISFNTSPKLVTLVKAFGKVFLKILTQGCFHEKKLLFFWMLSKSPPPPHIGPTLAPEAILLESPCTAHSET